MWTCAQSDHTRNMPTRPAVLAAHRQRTEATKDGGRATDSHLQSSRYVRVTNNTNLFVVTLCLSRFIKYQDTKWGDVTFSSMKNYKSQKSNSLQQSGAMSVRSTSRSSARESVRDSARSTARQAGVKPRGLSHHAPPTPDLGPPKRPKSLMTFNLTGTWRNGQRYGNALSDGVVYQ